MARTKSTRSAAGSGSIRQRPDGTWEARFVAGHDPGTGKPVRKSVYGKTQKEARQKLAQAVAAVDNADYFEPSKTELGKWLDIWLSEYQADKKYATTANYKKSVSTHIKPKLGAIKLSQLQPHTIQKFYNELLTSGGKTPQRDEKGKTKKKDGVTIYDPAPLSAKTVRNIHGCLTKALSVAVSIGYLRVNPCDRVTLPRIEKKELAPLTDDQVKQFLIASASNEMEIPLKVILFTGLRESEALGLTWDCIDFKAGTIRVCKQLQKRPQEDGGTILVNSTKSNKPRTIKAAPFVMRLLERQYKEQAMQRLQAGEIWKGWQNTAERKTALVFTTADGNYISHTSIRYHFKKIVKQIGAPDCRVHDLRHTFAVLSLQNGDDIKTVQGNLGHATAAFTLDVYGHVSEKMKDDSAARMEAYIASVSNS